MIARSLMLVCGLFALVGCGPAEQFSAEDDLTATDAAPSVVAVLPATPEMIDAVLRNEPLPVSAQSHGACHGSTPPCPSEYGSCSGWSSSYTCGTTWECGCTRCTGGGCFEGGRQVTTTETYRVCFNQAGASCTEYKNTSSYGTCSLINPC